MIIVIQCAGRKQPNAGYLHHGDGRRVMFVGNPDMIPDSEKDPTLYYTSPDNIADAGHSWREELVHYNAKPSDNPLGLLQAWQLYQNEVYALLAKNYGTNQLYILSAGWGLIAADFLIPNYDITFSNQAEGFKRRRRQDRYDDFNMLQKDIEAPVVFFLSNDYTPLACRLTEGMSAPRYLFHSSKKKPEAPGFNTVQYMTQTRTNWHYQCAKDFLLGRIGI